MPSRAFSILRRQRAARTGNGVGRHVRVGIAALAILAAGTMAARADDQRSTSDRLDRVEHELNQLQRQVYRNEVGGAPTPEAAPPLSSGGSALDLQTRMDQLESEIRTLTGQVEELQNGISQLKSAAEKTQADNELRFQQIEGTGNAPKNADAAPGAGDVGRPAPGPGFLVAPDDRSGTGRRPDAENNAGDGGDGDASPQDEYNAAYGLLRQRDFKGAEAAFRAFIKKNPSSPLVSNAQYWLGETYFVRDDWKTAAALFAEGYQKYPKGAKAAEDLLKLGISLGNLTQKREACASFARLDRDFPNAAPAVKEREAHERQHFGC